MNLTEQLRRYSGQERDIAEAILREVMPKLHEAAVKALRREYVAAPLSPTELINEVWLRSLHKGNWRINNRSHFYAIAALAMRRVLIDLARSRLATSNGAGMSPISFDDQAQQYSGSSSPERLVEIGQLMEKLEIADVEAARVMDMHYFAGFSIQEIVEITGWSDRQIRSRWRKAQNWLKDRL
jgi:RNA polymerase sigma factor (TIGR02999 family)